MRTAVAMEVGSAESIEVVRHCDKPQQSVATQTLAPCASATHYETETEPIFDIELCSSKAP